MDSQDAQNSLATSTSELLEAALARITAKTRLITMTIDSSVSRMLAMVTRLHRSNVKVRISPSRRRMDSPTEVPRTIAIAFQCLSMVGERGFYVRRHTIDSFAIFPLSMTQLILAGPGRLIRHGIYPRAHAIQQLAKLQVNAGQNRKTRITSQVIRHLLSTILLELRFHPLSKNHWHPPKPRSNGWVRLAGIISYS